MLYIYANIMPYDDQVMRNQLFNTPLKRNLINSGT